MFSDDLPLDPLRSSSLREHPRAVVEFRRVCAVPECDGVQEHYNRTTAELTCACGTQGSDPGVLVLRVVIREGEGPGVTMQVTDDDGIPLTDTVTVGRSYLTGDGETVIRIPVTRAPA